MVAIGAGRDDVNVDVHEVEAPSWLTFATGPKCFSMWRTTDASASPPPFAGSNFCSAALWRRIGEPDRVRSLLMCDILRASSLHLHVDKPGIPLADEQTPSAPQSPLTWQTSFGETIVL